ncbi:hypothetical protein JYU34_001978 [Plutella xylostella]|uniref:Uncharacterized protein n=1 Tax=Plutella xylostella TaxID=51655 RepID=A0ABQ7R5E5_PLUXY|nr:hypothetical protein JYU34_001978 [Plutella xylostella]
MAWGVERAGLAAALALLAGMAPPASSPRIRCCGLISTTGVERAGLAAALALLAGMGAACLFTAHTLLRVNKHHGT